MPIAERKIEPGTVLTAKYKGEAYSCEVVQTEGGLRYRLADGTEHRSPSSAGKAVTGGACNGWVFWSIAGEDTAKPKRAKKEPAAEKPAKSKAPPKKGAKTKGGKSKKSKAMRAAANGESFGCGVCPETFPTQKKAVAHTLTHTA
jgi:hypothetical protein